MFEQAGVAFALKLQWFPHLPFPQRLDQVPADKTERFEWLKKAYGSWMSVSPEARKSLEKWYGAEKASNVKYAESFEIAEYGRQPTEAEIRQIFPMLGN